MKTYSAIKAEIAKLEKQAETLLKTEVAGVIAKIKDAIEAYSLTAADLGFGSGTKAARGPKGKRGRKTATTVGVAKYRDPKTGKTWTGRGKPPNWIVGVKNRDAFLIDGQASTTAAEAPAKRGRKARAAAPVKAKAKATRGKGRTRRGAKLATVKTPAVQIESGAASE